MQLFRILICERWKHLDFDHDMKKSENFQRVMIKIKIHSIIIFRCNKNRRQDRQKGKKIMKTRFIGFKVTHKWGKPRVRKGHYRHYRTK